MIRRRLPALIALAIVALPTIAATPPVSARGAATLRLTLIEQDFTVRSAGEITLTVAVPASLDAATLDASDLVVTAYRPVSDRDAVQAALQSEPDFPNTVDFVVAPVVDLVRPQPNQVTLTIPVETNTLTPPAMLLSRAGVYPLTIELRFEGDTVAELTSFVNRLPTSGEVDDPMSVALVMGTTRPLHLDDSGEVVLDQGDLDELAALADGLEASAIPVAVRIEPKVIGALRERDPALATRLLDALDGNEIISGTSLPLDPSVAASAGQSALYTQWLRDGEDIVAADMPAPTVRTAQFVDHTVTTPGATLLRDLGTRLLVLTPDVYRSLDGSLGGFADTTQLVGIALDDDAQLEGAIVDRRIADTLERSAKDPTLIAIQVVADLLAARQRALLDDDLAARHSIVLGTNDLGVPDPATLAVITELIADTPGLQSADLDQVATRTTRQQVLGDDVVVRLPNTVDSSALTGRVQTQTDLATEATSTGSMLPDGDQRPSNWAAFIAILPTTALDDSTVASITGRLRSEYEAIRSAVGMPTPFSFSLTGRSSTIRLNFRNDSDTPLKIRVVLDSPKLSFPDPDQIETLPPHSVQEVLVRVEARTNGDFGVSLNVLTPQGDIEHARLGPTVALTASLNALSGLGNLVTGAAILMLAAWWFRHWRAVRRKRDAAAVIGRHPVSFGNAMPGDQGANGGELSPDAATSTLPPS